jgi:predicted transcriptional regulator
VVFSIEDVFDVVYRHIHGIKKLVNPRPIGAL